MVVNSKVSKKGKKKKHGNLKEGQPAVLVCHDKLPKWGGDVASF